MVFYLCMGISFAFLNVVSRPLSPKWRSAQSMTGYSGAFDLPSLSLEPDQHLVAPTHTFPSQAADADVWTGTYPRVWLVPCWVPSVYCNVQYLITTQYTLVE